jgi:hypothetical protein
VGVAAQLDVVQHRHAAEQRNVLEAARQAQPGAFGRRHARDVATLEADLPGCGAVEAGNGVEQRGLARAIGADDRGDGPGLHAKAHTGKRLDPAERQRDPIHLQQGRAVGLIHHLSPRLYMRSFYRRWSGEPARQEMQRTCLYLRQYSAGKSFYALR